MATIRVHTTQNVTLEYEVASIGDRIVATLIDYLIQIAWLTLWGLLFKAIGSSGRSVDHALDYGNSTHVAALVIAVIIGIIILGPVLFYNLIFEALLNGQTFGKKARHLRVVRLDGTSPGLGDYILRWLLRIVDLGFFYGLVAVITIAANGKGQRLGDLAAGTSVISLKPRPDNLANLAENLPPVGYQPVFPQAADLSDHDVALLRQLMSRSLAHDNYLLLHDTANKIKELLHVATDMSDEAFLRTVLRDHTHLLMQA